jgi:hypothetical protein
LLDDARLGRYIIKQIDLHFGFIHASSCLSSPDISSSLIYSTRALLLVVSGNLVGKYSIKDEDFFQNLKESEASSSDDEHSQLGDEESE